MATIRPHSPEDERELRKLVLELHETLRTFDQDLAPGEEIIEAYFSDMMSKVKDTEGAVYVAETHGQVDGYVCLFGRISPDDLDERPSPFAFLAELFVRPESRGRGVGRLLVERAERHALECNSHKMELKVLAQNEAATQFYESLDYRPRVVVMVKRLPARRERRVHSDTSGVR